MLVAVHLCTWGIQSPDLQVWNICTTSPYPVHICRTFRAILSPASPWRGLWEARGWGLVGERCTPPSGLAGMPSSHSLNKNRTSKPIKNAVQLPLLQQHRTSKPLIAPSRKGIESVLMVSRATISLLSLELLRLCFCFLLKKDLRAAAESVLLESSFISVTLCLR